LALVGERWSLLVVRELGFGVRRFNDIQRNTGAPREMLTARLRKLEEAGIVSRTAYSEHPPRYDYELTEAGRALAPVLRSLRRWGEQFATPGPEVQPPRPRSGTSAESTTSAGDGTTTETGTP
jgi:DNA-binding HxlR family transcriptional regulator